MGFSIVFLQLKPGMKEQDYIINFYDDREEKITKTYAIWKIDYETMKFQKIDIPINFQFYNLDWAEE
jgi:hypothetical protein